MVPPPDILREPSMTRPGLAFQPSDCVTVPQSRSSIRSRLCCGGPSLSWPDALDGDLVVCLQNS